MRRYALSKNILQLILEQLYPEQLFSNIFQISILQFCDKLREINSYLYVLNFWFQMRINLL